MGVEINRFSRNPSFTFYNFLRSYLGNFQSAFHKSQLEIFAQFHPCFHDETFLYILTTGFWLQPLLDYSWPISSINLLLKISPFSASPVLRAPLISMVNSMAIDIYEINQFDVVVKLFKTISLECTSWRLKRRASKTFEGFKTYPLLCVLDII